MDAAKEILAIGREVALQHKDELLALRDACGPVVQDPVEVLRHNARCSMVRACRSLGEKERERRLLEEIRPDVYCKGPEYTMDNLPEADTLRRLGTDLVTVGDPKDHSSTDLIARVRAFDAGEPAKAEP